MTEQKKVPWWLWPNLLSLDAPVVALAWFWMFAETWGVRSLPPTLAVSLALAVWAVYALDRILDSRNATPRRALQKRHQFHRKFRWYFLSAVLLAVVWSLYASLALLSQTALLYGCFIVLLCVAYFVLVVASAGRESTGLLKNFIAGMTFSYGTAAGVHSYSPLLSFTEMLFSWEVAAFGALCALNMTAIDFWELEGEEEEDASALLGTLTLMLAAVSFYLALSSGMWAKPFHYAIIAGTGGIYWLNRAKGQFDQNARRLWVDLVLLAPVLLFWVWTTYQRVLR